MVILNKISYPFLLIFLLAGCQLGYIAESAYHQADILRRRVPLQKALTDLPLTEREKKQIELALEVRIFMKEELGLEVGKNYSTYVALNRDYVSYAVSAAPKNELRPYKWHFPIIGSVPYKAYFKKERAKEMAKELAEEEDLDTFVRGVSAYSTLGWFPDPLLSSMLKYREHNLVDTLIHETVHANLYIKGQSKFNERVATFLGQIGAEAFYKKKAKGKDVIALVGKENKDELIFSNFITKEIKNLRQWYIENKGSSNLLEAREKKFTELQLRFKEKVVPQLQTPNYKKFAEVKLNNARLLLYELYQSDFSDFEKVAAQYDRDFKKVFSYLKTLETVENPEEKLKRDAG